MWATQLATKSHRASNDAVSQRRHVRLIGGEDAGREPERPYDTEIANLQPDRDGGGRIGVGGRRVGAAAVAAVCGFTSYLALFVR
ncbi:Uncharacterised protein [Mycobacteroides abscessus subsp. massiliense]|nr:Uncharacterised protein [Mycobacteroides abscessus subsp. massiliense]SLD38210.1 Uncharacterised protein [Mycobacteroides abscessus subsp. massiliense]